MQLIRVKGNSGKVELESRGRQGGGGMQILACEVNRLDSNAFECSHCCILDPVNLYHHHSKQKAPQTVNTARPTTLPIGRNTVLSKANHKPAWNICPPENVNGWSDGREMRRRG